MKIFTPSNYLKKRTGEEKIAMEGLSYIAKLISDNMRITVYNKRLKSLAFCRCNNCSAVPGHGGQLMSFRDEREEI